MATAATQRTATVGVVEHGNSAVLVTVAGYVLLSAQVVLSSAPAFMVHNQYRRSQEITAKRCCG